MTLEVQTTTIGEILETLGGEVKTGPFGTVLKASEYTNSGVPVISVGEIGHGEFRIHGRTPYVDKSVTDRLPEFVLRENDIVFARKGSVERTALVGQTQVGWFLGSDGIRLRLPKSISARFVRYWISSSETRDWLLQNSTGSTMASLNQATIKRLPIVLPCLRVQTEVASILGALDDKIELNRRMSATLEEMARALYRSWFVDFDPVHARAAGLSPAHMTPTTAALFPDSFGPDGLPKGWENAEIGQDLLILDSKRVPLSKHQRQKRQGSVPYYGATSIMDHVDEYIFDDVLLLVGEDGSVVKPDGKPFTQYIWGKSWVNNHAHVLKGKKFSVEQLKCFFETVSIAEFITGAVQLKLNQGNMKKIPWVKAADTVHYAFDELIKPWHTKIRLLEDETANLAALRDALLPRLMSGDLRIREAAQQVEGVV
ncbi:EcoKI restriction-modification system protein HsdS [Sulfitobacter sp. THAF37]|uniref:restriction endonuclease subunit S n=1 Tax=Sulfitobacter sp. THAF37 TaxID=2587855 RepID=UPI0012684589|nr:restriction endonuclease subunit S [Sulfitobacter sp. THAF37]QFT59417.1 EcoKI restriction-modification system protein HsdS [Sulfitobacter sp. THAF37]